MGDVLRVEHIRADPGRTARGYLDIAELRDGTPARLPVALVNGVQDGPTFYLQSISDGDELNGLAVIRQIRPCSLSRIGSVSYTHLTLPPKA